MKNQVLYSKILAFLKEEEYFSLLSNFISYHRIQGTPEMMKAMRYLNEKLSEFGIDKKYVEEVMQPHERVFGFPYFVGWKPLSLNAKINTSKKRIVLDFDLNAHTFIQRSKPIRGRYLIVDENSKVLRKNVFVLTDNLRRCMYSCLSDDEVKGIVLFDKNVPDFARKKAQFWYFSQNEPHFSGVVLSPLEAGFVRSDIKKRKRVYVNIEVSGRYYEAQNAYLLARIDGKKEDAILYIAHTCHAKGEANDNGSGVSSLIYTALVLRKMLNKGILKKPPYTIYFLFVPEMWGTALFIEREKQLLKNIFMGVNFDMVGSDPLKTQGVVFVEKPHPIILTNAHEILQKHLAQVSQFLDFEAFPIFRNFEGGSDHLLFQEPALKIPVPMIIHWPDRFYHTDHDVISNINIKAIWRNVILMISLPYMIKKEKIRFSIKRFNKKNKKDVYMRLKRGVFMPTLDGNFSKRLKWYERLENKGQYVNFSHFLFYMDGRRSVDNILSDLREDAGIIPDKNIYEEYIKYLEEINVIEKVKYV